MTVLLLLLLLMMMMMMMMKRGISDSFLTKLLHSIFRAEIMELS
jgi:hypothetical protein